MQNAFPSDHGVSDNLSPRNLVENLPNLDFHSIKIPFGSYAQVAVDKAITNTPRPRTLGCIVLDPIGINQKYRFMSLETGRKVSGRIARILPVTDEVISRVNEIGREQKQPVIQDGRLLFEWRPGQLVDEDLYLLDEALANGDDDDGDDDIVPDPVDDDGPDVLSDAESTVGAPEVTEEEESRDDKDNLEEGFLESDTPIGSELEDDGSDHFSSGEEFESDSESHVYSDEELVDYSSLESEAEMRSASSASVASESGFESGPEASVDRESKTSEPDDEFGRGLRGRMPNPKYFNEDFSNFQFLQESFELLSY